MRQKQQRTADKTGSQSLTFNKLSAITFACFSIFGSSGHVSTENL